MFFRSTSVEKNGVEWHELMRFGHQLRWWFVQRVVLGASQSWIGGLEERKSGEEESRRRFSTGRGGHR